MSVQLFRLLLLMSFIAVSAGCTTTTRLIGSEISVGQPALRADSNNKASGTTISKTNSGLNKQINREPNTTLKPENYEQTFSRLKPLAEQGQADAQYTLGYMYYNGLGVPRDGTLAIQWMMAAANQGNKKSMEALRRIALSSADATDNAETTTSTTISTTTQDSEKKPESKITISEKAQAVKSPKTTVSRLPEVSSEVMTQRLASGAQTRLTDNERWILNQPNKHFTIQLIATGNESAMQRFITEHNLSESAVYYQTRRNDNDWFTLIQGSFASLSLAKIAIQELGSSLQTTKPWIKPISDIQETLATR